MLVLRGTGSKLNKCIRLFNVLIVMPTSFFWQILILQGTSSKLEQENKFMTEALEDLQDSTSRLEAENRTLKNASSPTKRIPGTPGAGGSGKVSLCIASFLLGLRGGIICWTSWLVNSWVLQ